MNELDPPLVIRLALAIALRRKFLRL